MPGIRKSRTLIICHDVMGERMAGPGIRYFHLSRVLSHHTDLTLAILPQDERALPAIRARLPQASVIAYRPKDWATLELAVRRAEVVILSPFAAHDFPQIGDYPVAIVLDGYDPLVAEYITSITADAMEQQIARWSWYLDALYRQYLVADFFICASERQRFWWFGQLEAAGRVNPLTYAGDPSLRNLVDVVPYGLPDEPPAHTKRLVKGVWPGIAEDDVVLLWGGGLWPWLDPLTAVRAVHRLRDSRPRLKLIFPGTVHPNPEQGMGVPVRQTTAYAYAREHRLLDKAVFFGEWVPYDDWQSVLLESDIALSLHHDTLETQLAFRSRMLEYFWAGVPVIATTGDATADYVTRYNLGRIVAYESDDQVIQAIEDILANPSAFRPGFARARQELTWERAAEPLVRFCRQPRRASDRQAARQAGHLLKFTPYERKVREIEALQARVRELEALAAAYESGRFMRLMRRVHDARRGLVRWLTGR
jgi:glycosyltransferase involved in cell wall biosynthesis